MDSVDKIVNEYGLSEEELDDILQGIEETVELLLEDYECKEHFSSQLVQDLQVRIIEMYVEYLDEGVEDISVENLYSEFEEPEKSPARYNVITALSDLHASTGKYEEVMVDVVYSKPIEMR